MCACAVNQPAFSVVASVVGGADDAAVDHAVLAEGDGFDFELDPLPGFFLSPAYTPEGAWLLHPGGMNTHRSASPIDHKGLRHGH